MKKKLMSLILLVSLNTRGADVGFAIWPGWVDRVNEGFGYELFDSVRDKSLTSLEFKPYKRALKDFVEQRDRCYFGLNSVFFKNNFGIDTIESNPLLYASLVFYTVKGKKVYKSLKVLKGKVIVKVHGTSLKGTPLENFPFERIVSKYSNVEGIELLKTG